MRRYNQRLYRIARTILRNDADAEDVMQEAYVRAYQHLSDFAGEAKFSTWLTKIAIYEALGRRRQARTKIPKSIEDVNMHIMNTVLTDERDPERQAYDQELRAVLEHAIEALHENYRSVFVLRIVEGLDVADIYGFGNQPESVKTRLHCGRALLRKELQRRAGIVAPELFPFHLSRCDRVVEVFRRINTGE